MVEMKLNRLLLTLVIKKFISNDDQLHMMIITSYSVIFAEQKKYFVLDMIEQKMLKRC